MNAIFHKMDSYSYLEDVPCTVDETFSQMEFSVSDFCISLDFSHLALSKVLEKEAVALDLHAHHHRARNYTCLLSNTALRLSIANILLVLCERDVVPLFLTKMFESIFPFLAG